MKNALKKCLQEKGYVDIKYICEMTDRRWDAVIEELGNEIYLNPEKMDLMDITVGWETAEEYLSGNLLDKYETAIENNSKYPDFFEQNVWALKEQIYISQLAGLNKETKSKRLQKGKENMITKEDIIRCFDDLIHKFTYLRNRIKFENVLLCAIQDCYRFKYEIEMTELPVEKIIKAIGVFKFWFRTRYRDVAEHYIETISGYGTYEDENLTKDRKQLYLSLGQDLCSMSKEIMEIVNLLYSEMGNLKLYDPDRTKENFSKLKGLSQEEFREKVKKALKSTDKEDMQIVELGLNSRNSVRYFEEIMGQDYPELHVDGIPMFIVFPYEEDDEIRYAGIPYNYFDNKENEK